MGLKQNVSICCLQETHFIFKDIYITWMLKDNTIIINK